MITITTTKQGCDMAETIARTLNQINTQAEGSYSDAVDLIDRALSKRQLVEHRICILVETEEGSILTNEYAELEVRAPARH